MKGACGHVQPVKNNNLLINVWQIVGVLFTLHDRIRYTLDILGLSKKKKQYLSDGNSRYKALCGKKGREGAE